MKKYTPYIRWALILIAAWIILVENGGDTIVILNHSADDICEVHLSYDPEEDGWGRNQILSPIRLKQSRDIRLPLYWEWFMPDKEAGYSGMLVNCDGEELEVLDGLGIDTNFIVWDYQF